MYINKDGNVTKHNTVNKKSVSIADNLDIVFARKLDITASCAASKKCKPSVEVLKAKLRVGERQTAAILIQTHIDRSSKTVLAAN